MAVVQERKTVEAESLVGRLSAIVPKPPPEAGQRRISGAEEIIPFFEPEPDGYIRSTPVQPIRTAPDYTARRVKKAVGIIVTLAVIAVLVWLLLRSGIFTS